MALQGKLQKKKNSSSPLGALYVLESASRPLVANGQEDSTRLIQSTELIRGQDPHSSSLLHLLHSQTGNTACFYYMFLDAVFFVFLASWLRVSNVQSCIIWNLECKCHESHFVISCWFPYTKKSRWSCTVMSKRAGLYSNPPRLECYFFPVGHFFGTSPLVFLGVCNKSPSNSSLKMANITLSGRWMYNFLLSSRE